MDKQKKKKNLENKHVMKKTAYLLTSIDKLRKLYTR